MTTTPDKTPEQAIAEAMQDMWPDSTLFGDPWSSESHEVLSIAGKLRAAGWLQSAADEQIVGCDRDDMGICRRCGEGLNARVLLDGDRKCAAGLLVGDPTEEQIEGAARALCAEEQNTPWERFHRIVQDRYRATARIALAGARVAVQEPSGCAESHRAEGHKLDCSHRLALQEPSEYVVNDDLAASELSREPNGWDEELAPQKPSEDDRAMQIAREIARMHTFTTVDALSIANAALALAAQPVLDPERVKTWLQREFGSVLAHDPHNPDRFWGGSASAFCEAAKRGELT